MAFFPRNFYTETPSSLTSNSFTPLFRLLDDFDNYSRQGKGHQQRQCRRSSGHSSALTSWQPKFDVREVSDAYELHGELPGITKENVHIEFTDPQTMVIRGRSERSYSAGTSPQVQQEQEQEQKKLEDATVPVTSDTEAQEVKSSHQTTVEDEEESLSHESGYEEIATPTTEHEQQHQLQTQVQEAKQPRAPKNPVDNAKYWLTERSIGEFTRSFSFPARVEQDNVTASFKDGVLSITVPKAKKHEVRRIAIF